MAGSVVSCSSCARDTEKPIRAGSVEGPGASICRRVGRRRTSGSSTTSSGPSTSAPASRTQPGTWRCVSCLNSGGIAAPPSSPLPPGRAGPCGLPAADPYRVGGEMDFREFIKKLDVPPGHSVPERLTYDDVVARAISRADLREDVRGINASLELIRPTRGCKWPAAEVTDEFNFVDLVWHDAELRDGGSYSYAVYDVNVRHLGCCYLYPMGRRTQLTEELLKYDVVVSSWVTPTAYDEGYYPMLYRALGPCLAEGPPVEVPYYSN